LKLFANPELRASTLGLRSESDNPIADDAAKKGTNASKENESEVDA
jgi:hypothetical protein